MHYNSNIRLTANAKFHAIALTGDDSIEGGLDSDALFGGEGSDTNCNN